MIQILYPKLISQLNLNKLHCKPPLGKLIVLKSALGSVCIIDILTNLDYRADLGSAIWPSNSRYTWDLVHWVRMGVMVTTHKVIPDTAFRAVGDFPVTRSSVTVSQPFKFLNEDTFSLSFQKLHRKNHTNNSLRMWIVWNWYHIHFKNVCRHQLIWRFFWNQRL